MAKTHKEHKAQLLAKQKKTSRKKNYVLNILKKNYGQFTW